MWVPQKFNDFYHFSINWSFSYVPNIQKKKKFNIKHFTSKQMKPKYMFYKLLRG